MPPQINQKETNGSRTVGNLFPHENQKVYQLGIEWVVMVEQFVDLPQKRKGLSEQLDKIANSIPIHIVDATGKSNASDRVKSIEMAKGAVLACAAVLDMMVARNVLEPGDAIAGKRHLSQMARLLSGMIQSANTHEMIRNRITA
ncbi:MAG: four helix bundle protein [Verrucomicrobiota bacterium]